MSNLSLKQQKKAWIVDHAISMFTRKGYHDTSIADIAKSIPISTGAIYQYFKSKEDLFAYIIALMIDEMDTIIALLEISDYKILERVIEKLLDVLHQNLNISSKYLFLFRHFNELIEHDLSTILKDKYLQLYEITEALIKKGQQDHYYKTGDSYMLTSLFYANLQGLVSMRFFLKDDFNIPKIEDILSIIK